MLIGERIQLRPVREKDLPTFIDAHFDLRNRGAYFPLGVASEPARIADKCGFVLEGTVRGAFFNGGRNHDVLLYSLLRTDPRPWHDADGKAK